MKTATMRKSPTPSRKGQASHNGSGRGNGTANGHSAAHKKRPKNGAPKTIRLSEAIELVPLDLLVPALINDKIYKPVDPSDPAVIALSKDIADKGLLEPIIVSEDNVVISGHRRMAACRLAGMDTILVRRINMRSSDDRFESYLVSFNQQRVKSVIEQIREEVIRTSPEDAHNALLIRRQVESTKSNQRVQGAGLRILDPAEARRRCDISGAKVPMLNAAVEIIDTYRKYWPLTLRQIHYRLLNKSVLRNSRDPDSRYVNTQQCYKDLSNLLTRARLVGSVPWEAMHDPTRPRTRWQQWNNVGTYVREELDGFLGSYKRDLLQSQPAYVELVVEKITVHDIAKRAAGYYHVPVGVGKGYTSVTSLDETANRFHASGKDHFILLIAGDFDPEGENICDTWAACLRDEHEVENITPVKVGVNYHHIHQYNLSPLPIKKTSSRARGFEAVYGKNVYELEAFEPDQLQQIIVEAIRAVLDLELFAQEQRRESEEARLLMACRKQVRGLLQGCDFLELTVGLEL